MSELVLHIGAPKTGTTSLQKFFTHNRLNLNNYGWDYPPLTAQWSSPAGRRNGNFLTQLCRDRLESTSRARDIEENMHLLEQSLSSCTHVLLSDEELLYSPTKLSSMDIEEALSEFWNEVSQVADSLPVLSVTCILYLRRQDEWLASWWKEMIKNGETDQSFSTFSSSAHVRDILKYSTLINLIERAFSKPCTIVVRLYNRNSFEGSSIYTDFCAAAGIPWDYEYSLPEKDLNLSLSFDVAEALREFKSSSSYGEPLRMLKLIPLARTLSQESPDPSRMTPFSKEESETLLNSYREENERVARRFFGRDELFVSDNTEPIVWDPDERKIQHYIKLFQKECRRYRAWGWFMEPYRYAKKSVAQSLRRIKRG